MYFLEWYKKIRFRPKKGSAIDRSIQYLQDHAKAIVSYEHFENVVHSLVIVNAIILSIDHYPATDSFIDTMDAINFVLIIAFTFELILKGIVMPLIAYIFLVSINLIAGMNHRYFQY